MLRACLAVVILLGCSFQSRAQGRSPASECVIAIDIPDVCFSEFAKWLFAERAWRQWMELYGNQFVRNDRQRKARPAPPGWLVDHCAERVDADLASADLCPRFKALQDFDVRDEDRNRKILLVLGRERVAHTSWLRHVHIDGPWSTTQVPSGGYGVIGLHAAFEVEGRFELFLAPGVLLFALSDGGVTRWTPAWNYGVGFRLFDFRLPGIARSLRLHANLAKAWTFDGTIQGLDVVGLSVTFDGRPERPQAVP